MGSTDARARAGVWTQIVETKCNDAKTKELAKDALKSFQNLSGQRNDFIHSYFATVVKTVKPGITLEAIYRRDVPSGGEGVPVAIKVRTRKLHPAAAIEGIRDDAAAAAHLFYQIASSTFAQWRAEHRPSLRKSAQQPLSHPANRGQS
jgi:hypothetical protein